MGLGDELAGLGHHGGLVLAAQVDGVADAHDVHAGLAHGQHGVQVVELRRIGVVLAAAHDVGLGVHLHEVVDLGIVGGVLRDEPALAGQHAAHALAPDLEEVLRLGIGDVDALAVEVLVEVLDLLIAREQHETARSARRLHEVLDVLVTGFRHDVGRHPHLVTSDFGHGFLLIGSNSTDEAQSLIDTVILAKKRGGTRRFTEKPRERATDSREARAGGRRRRRNGEQAAPDGQCAKREPGCFT